MATDGSEEGGRGRGRPPFKPTPKQRKQVTELVAVGMKQDDIARVIGISTPTLTLHFEDELRTGIAKKRAEVIADLFKNSKKGNVSAQKKLEEMTRLAAAQAAVDPEQPAQQQPTKTGYVGKKEAAREGAQDAGRGTEWGNDLLVGPEAANRPH